MHPLVRVEMTMIRDLRASIAFRRHGRHEQLHFRPADFHSRFDQVHLLHSFTGQKTLSLVGGLRMTLLAVQNTPKWLLCFGVCLLLTRWFVKLPATNWVTSFAPATGAVHALQYIGILL